MCGTPPVVRRIVATGPVAGAKITSFAGGGFGVTTGGDSGLSMPSEQPASSATATSDVRANACENLPRPPGPEN